jgi:hypothetical protein
MNGFISDDERRQFKITEKTLLSFRKQIEAEELKISETG